MYDKVYVKVFPDYRKELEASVGKSKSLLDVGCGSNSPIRNFSNNLECVGVDLFQPSIDKSKANNIHDKYVKINIMDIGEHFPENSFDCVLASDVIEHFEKEEGLQLIKMMEKIARKKVIIFTPNGFMPQEACEGNPWQEHKSGWEVEEMKNLGFQVTGIHGLKSLRGERANIRFKPQYFWLLISDITQKFTKHKPHAASQILCVKDLSSEEV